MEFLRKEFGIDRHSVEVREREIRSGHETRAILIDFYPKFNLNAWYIPGTL